LRSSRARSSNVKRKENGGIRDPVCPIGRFIVSAPAGQPRYALKPHSNPLILQIMRSTFLCRSAPKTFRLKGSHFQIDMQGGSRFVEMTRAFDVCLYEVHHFSLR